ncbi:uncharacterized protein LOC143226491 [Tachypleus tridentatus]|uniref:uncharacterized protein LOC143226491 n=1 Tax=Tachypleus tridentatus TaxID=6853 RepID=UPI003FD68B80
MIIRSIRIQVSSTANMTSVITSTNENPNHLAVEPTPHSLYSKSLSSESNGTLDVISTPSSSFCQDMKLFPCHSPLISTTQRKKSSSEATPNKCKDETYWKRRKRNNESAKRSRALRKLKEYRTTQKIMQLQQENITLRTEACLLRNQLEKMQNILFSRASVINTN